MTQQNDLSTNITKSVVASPFQPRFNHSFAPGWALSYITKDSIIRHFSQNHYIGLGTSHPLDEPLIEYILRNDVKELFGICIASGIPKDEIIQLMRRCKDYGITNHIIIQADEKIKGTFATCNQVWTDRFVRWRYLFRAPVLSHNRRHEKRLIHNYASLPIVSAGTHPKIGGFAKVHEVIIHASFLDEADPIRKGGCKAAIKELSDGPEGWQRETTALETIGAQYNLSHLVDVTAMIMQASTFYLFFPWANGGNLMDFWERYDSYSHRHDIARDFIGEIVEQILGLSNVLQCLHNFARNGEISYRHGDLKPENILVFQPPGSPSHKPGIWKIADLGLAKLHEKVTGARYNMKATSMRGWGTTSYKPPESFSNPHSPTSRLFDIWSMGCILLQLITWLVYGMQRLKDLAENTKIQDNSSCFWEGTWNRRQGWIDLEVHGKVLELIEDLRRDLGEPCGEWNALLELLTIVQNHLLIVPETGLQSRMDARGLYSAVQEIHQKCQRNVPYRSLAGKVKMEWNSGVGQGTSYDLGNQQIDLDETWNFPLDNTFPASLFRRSEDKEIIPTATRQAAKLCSKCKDLDIFAQEFQVTDTISRLREMASSCDFCKIRLEASQDILPSDATTIAFNRVDSNLQLDGRYPPVLTINRDPDVIHNTDTASHGLQIGLPQLPEAGTMAYFEILQHWLLKCDEEHTSCRSANSKRKPLPTRVIDVESKDPSLVKLHETEHHDTYEYFALSHPWGPQSANHFCTFRGNLAEHKKGIRIEKLPATFQDAIRVTRGLGHRYLWIDSICIIQGKDGDFNDEAKHMEDVFSQAYCVLAASSATSQHDGFLKPRDERKYLTFREDPSARIYVSEFIDNFQQHVLNSHMNQRGWVFQERVLAKRTIYFTGKQTYWECGGGVRCETMTKMHNQLASFLGDPNFPKVAMEANRGEKIRLYQDLYARYSRLGFSHFEDRPIAIAGLEKRLISSLGLRGGFGILDDTGPGFFRRSLLWRRAQDEHDLHLIAFKDKDGPASRTGPPPTWSWMAYKGAIEYLNLPFDHVEWDEQDIISPWARNSLGTWTYSLDLSTEPRSLRVTARDYDAIAAATDDTTNIIIDTPAVTQPPGSVLRCVVLGRLKHGLEDTRGDRRHFVLLVKTTGSKGRGPRVYLRAGVGVMPGRIIDMAGRGTDGIVL